MRKEAHYKEILKILKDLKTQFPTYNMGRHISMALADYPDMWSLNDKEFLFALNKYQVELEIDSGITSDKSINKIIDEGMHLDAILDDNDNDY